MICKATYLRSSKSTPSSPHRQPRILNLFLFFLLFLRFKNLNILLKVFSMALKYMDIEIGLLSQSLLIDQSTPIGNCSSQVHRVLQIDTQQASRTNIIIRMTSLIKMYFFLYSLGFGTISRCPVSFDLTLRSFILYFMMFFSKIRIFASTLPWKSL